jgi:hypothetical protein
LAELQQRRQEFELILKANASNLPGFVPSLEMS